MQAVGLWFGLYVATPINLELGTTYFPLLSRTAAHPPRGRIQKRIFGRLCNGESTLQNAHPGTKTFLQKYTNVTYSHHISLRQAYSTKSRSTAPWSNRAACHRSMAVLQVQRLVHKAPIWRNDAKCDGSIQKPLLKSELLSL